MIYKVRSGIDKALNYGKRVAKKAVLTGLIAGMCYGSSWAQSSEEPDYFPLKVGNSWTYSSGRTETIIGTSIIDGKTYYEFDGLLFGLRHNPLYRIKEKNQLVEYMGEELPFFNTTEAVRYEFSLDVGDSWGGFWRSDPFDSIFIVRIRSKKETVTVPAGTFANCLHLEYVYLSPSKNWEEWIAPGVGPVRRAGGYTVFTSLIGAQAEELVKAEINGVRYPDGSSEPKSYGWPRPSEASQIGDYYPPLQVGNFWIYSVQYGDNWGIETQRIVGREVVNRHVYYRFNYFPNVGRKAKPLYRVDDRNRFVEYIDGEDVVRYRPFVDVGDSWASVPPPLYPFSLVIVTGVNETVVVPAGTFTNCVHLTYIGAGIWKEWLAPGVGLVKFIDYGGGLVTITNELLEVNVSGLRYPTSVEPNTWGRIKSTFVR